MLVRHVQEKKSPFQVGKFVVKYSFSVTNYRRSNETGRVNRSLQSCMNLTKLIYLSMRLDGGSIKEPNDRSLFSPAAFGKEGPLPTG